MELWVNYFEILWKAYLVPLTDFPSMEGYIVVATTYRRPRGNAIHLIAIMLSLIQKTSMKTILNYVSWFIWLCVKSLSSRLGWNELEIFEANGHFVLLSIAWKRIYYKNRKYLIRKEILRQNYLLGELKHFFLIE